MLNRTIIFTFLLLPFLGITQSEMRVVNYTQLEEYLTQYHDQLIVVNFWATWCKPCIKELPFFEALHENSDSEKVKVLLVSLDFKNQIESKLLPFIEENGLDSEVLVLFDNDMNTWINKVDPSWSGAIPATMLLEKNSKAFFEREFHSLEELEEVIHTFKN